MDNRYLYRLPKITHFENEVCQNICDSYKLGDFKSFSVVETGYEDFNFILITATGKYFVKIFNKERRKEDCQRISDLITLIIKNNVAHPKLYKTDSGSILHKIRIGSNNLYLIVMEYIDGKSFFESNMPLTREEIKQLAEILVKINSINLKEIPYIYDSWAVPNLAKEYIQKKKYLKEEEIKLLEPIMKEFYSMNLKSLPHSLVHGDILKTNVLKDKSGKVWIVDFSVANLYPRILEIAIASTHLLFDISSKEKTDKNLRILLGEYEKTIKLEKEEKETLSKFIRFSYGIEYLNTIFEERVNGNKSRENSYLLEEAKMGIEWS